MRENTGYIRRVVLSSKKLNAENEEKKRIETGTRVKLSAHLLNQAPTPRRLPQFSRLESPNPFPSSSSSRRSVDEQIRPCNAAAGTTRARPAGPRLSYRRGDFAGANGRVSRHGVIGGEAGCRSRIGAARRIGSAGGWSSASPTSAPSR
jgi:hypothetical protein